MNWNILKAKSSDREALLESFLVPCLIFSIGAIVIIYYVYLPFIADWKMKSESDHLIIQSAYLVAKKAVFWTMVATATAVTSIFLLLKRVKFNMPSIHLVIRLEKEQEIKGGITSNELLGECKK
jgi:cytochrome c oxidase assembly factor CtaG